MDWTDVGHFLTRDSAPWWAIVGVPVLTFWLGQRASQKVAAEQRSADAEESRKSREAEKERLRSAREVEDATMREQRLFDHRRAAHYEFLTEYTKHENELSNLVWEDAAVPEADAYIRPLLEKLPGVTIYGTLNAAAKARQLIIDLALFAESSSADRESHSDKLNDSRLAYVYAARGDLGVVDPPSFADLLAEVQRGAAEANAPETGKS
jgi:hypothetical protein